MKIVFIVRNTLFTVRGGDTVQVQETAEGLRNAGVEVDIRMASEKIDYTVYDGLHFFNITRPADMLLHIQKSRKPFVVSTILINYALYDKYQRPGLTGKLLSLFPAQTVEYIKAAGRFITGRDKLVSIDYLWKGQRASIREVLQKAKAVLVQAKEEYDDLVLAYGIKPVFFLVRNGISTTVFKQPATIARQANLVLCAARIEGIKNQLNLIRALNNTEYELVLAGNAAPGQQAYYRQCKHIAAANVSFTGHLCQQELAAYYALAKVHVLPSWFEVCGLSSLEAAAMGCNVVITDNGYARSYFKDAAFYCDPSSPESILKAVKMAAVSDAGTGLQQTIAENYSWQKTAADTLAVYKKLFY